MNNQGDHDTLTQLFPKSWGSVVVSETYRSNRCCMKQTICGERSQVLMQCFYFPSVYSVFLIHAFLLFNAPPPPPNHFFTEHSPNAQNKTQLLFSMEYSGSQFFTQTKQLSQYYNCKIVFQKLQNRVGQHKDLSSKTEFFVDLSCLRK